MRPTRTLFIIAGLLTGCLSIDQGGSRDTGWRYHEVCAEGVKIFTSPKRVTGDYEEIALLDSTGTPGWENDREEAAIRRRSAGELGANGIIIGENKNPAPGRKVFGPLVGTEAERRTAALAIFVRSDSQRVQRACATSGARLAAKPAKHYQRRTRNGPVLGYAPSGMSVEGSAPSGSGLSLKRVRATRVPDSSVVYKALATDPPSVDEVTLARNPEMRWTMATARRIGIAEGFRESHPGILQVMVADGFRSAPALSYTLAELWQAYHDHRAFDEPLLLELWQDNQKVGEYTEGGLALKPQ